MQYKLTLFTKKKKLAKKLLPEIYLFLDTIDEGGHIGIKLNKKYFTQRYTPIKKVQKGK